MGLIVTTKVVSRAEMPDKPWLIQPGNREWVTTIECVNSRAWPVPSTIIFKGKVHIEGWFDEAGILHKWRIELSPNGWTSNIIGHRWLQQVFIPAINSRTRGIDCWFWMGMEATSRLNLTRRVRRTILYLSACLLIYLTFFSLWMLVASRP